MHTARARCWCEGDKLRLCAEGPTTIRRLVRIPARATRSPRFFRTHRSRHQSPSVRSRATFGSGGVDQQVDAVAISDAGCRCATDGWNGSRCRGVEPGRRACVRRRCNVPYLRSLSQLIEARKMQKIQGQRYQYHKSTVRFGTAPKHALKRTLKKPSWQGRNYCVPSLLSHEKAEPRASKLTRQTWTRIGPKHLTAMNESGALQAFANTPDGSKMMRGALLREA